MGNWRRWIRPGLAVTVILAVLAFIARNGSIEHDIGERVASRLASEGQSWAVIDVSARNVTILGTAPSPESQELALGLASTVRGVRSVSNASDLLPMASPYVWSARKDGRAVTLTGSVPSDGFRNSLLAAARRALPEGEIRDQMALARGAPASFNTSTTFALARLSGLSEGIVTLTDAVLSASGVAADSSRFEAARRAFTSELPKALSLGPVDILPARADPFVWSADFDGKEVTLAGNVPNEIVKQSLVATAKATLSGTTVTDTMRVASGAPAGFSEAATFAIGTLKGLKEGGIMLDGLALDVAGSASSVDDYDAAIARLSGSLPDGMTVVAAAITPATVSPYGWTGEKADNAVILSGFVPSAGNRTELASVAEAYFAGARIDNRVRVAAGEPRMDWLGAIKFAMGQLAQLRRGKVTLAANSYTIEGEADSPEAFTTITATNGGTLPASLELTRAEVAPPKASPYRFIAERSAGGVVLAGYVANEADHEELLDAVARKFGRVPITDRLALASGAPDGFIEAARAGMQGASRLARGRLEIIDKELAVTGDAYYPAAAEDVVDTVTEALPKGFVLAKQAIGTRQVDQPIEAGRCRDLLQSDLQRGRIEFDGSKADISADSFALLDRMSATIARCPDASIEIGAHSDSAGSTSRNRDLTQARAEAIVDYLVTAGVQRERLTAVGYGEANPVADNNTEDGKAANRRIEFKVATPDGG